MGSGSALRKASGGLLVGRVMVFEPREKSAPEFLLPRFMTLFFTQDKLLASGEPPGDRV